MLLKFPSQKKRICFLRTNAAAMENGATFASSNLFQVNEQKYFASTEGSYIDQDIHRIWPTFTVTTIDKAAGLFKTRQALSAPMGMGYEYMIPKNEDKLPGPAGVDVVSKQLRYGRRCYPGCKTIQRNADRQVG